MRQLTGVILILLILSSCNDTVTDETDNTPLGRTADTKADNTADETFEYKLVLKPLADGAIHVLVPSEFSIARNDTLKSAGQPVSNTWRYISRVDSVSAVGVSIGIEDKMRPTRLKKFADNLEKQLRSTTNVRRVKRGEKRIDGQDYAYIIYTEWDKDTDQEVNQSALMATVYNSNVLTLNVFFAGKVKKGYDIEMMRILNSIQLEKAN